MDFVKLRIMAGFRTQRELADALGVSLTAASLWECGKRVPRPAQLFRLAKLFGVEIGDVLNCFKDKKE